MKSRIPQPKSKLAALRWKTKLEIPKVVKLDGTNQKIYIAENPSHVFFHDETKGDDTTSDITSQIWGYGTDPATVSSPGPTLEAFARETVGVEWINNLPPEVHHPFVEPPRELRPPGMMSRYDVGHTVVHLHGAHVPWTSDGYSIRVSKGIGKNPLNKKTVLRPGQSEIFEYPNTQPGGGTLWYHDHTMDMTSMNVYAGLAGAYLLRHKDENTLASLPKDVYEIPLIIQDRSFTEDGELLYGDANFLQDYLNNGVSPDPANFNSFREGFFGGDQDSQPSPEFKGQVICVNGKIWPFLEVEPRPYRFRIVNGSNSRMYVMRLSDSKDNLNLEPDLNISAAGSLLQIGADGGLLAQSIPLDGTTVDTKHYLVLASGERADVIIDFSDLNGKSIFLTNHAVDNSPLGNGGDAPVAGAMDGIIKFVVNQELNLTANSALKPDLANLDADLFNVASLPDLANNSTMPLQPTRQYLIKEFGPIPLTEEEAKKPRLKDGDGRGWNAITFQQNVKDFTNPGLLWGGSPPYQDILFPPVHGAVPNGGPQPDKMNTPLHLLGSTIEVWDFYNISVDVHPLHLHHSYMQLYSRVDIDIKDISNFPIPVVDMKGVDPNEKGWKDTIRVNPQQLTRILVRFDNGGDNTRSPEYYTGHYVWHCHILEHEDMGMMRPLEIELPPVTQTGCMPFWKS